MAYRWEILDLRNGSKKIFKAHQLSAKEGLDTMNTLELKYGFGDKYQREFERELKEIEREFENVFAHRKRSNRSVYHEHR